MKQYQHYNCLPASDDICRLLITFENSFHSDQKVSEYDQEIPQSHTVDQMCFASENIVNNNNNIIIIIIITHVTMRKSHKTVTVTGHPKDILKQSNQLPRQDDCKTRKDTK